MQMKGFVSKRSTGKRVTTWALIAALLLTMTIGLTTGVAEAKSGTWKHNKVGWWYSYSDGTYAKKTWKKIGKNWYYFLSNGYMETSAYRDGYYIGKNGVMSKKRVGGKWKKDKTGWWYTDKTHWYPKNEWVKIDGKYYFFNTKGYLVTNQWVNHQCVNKNGAWVKKASTDWAKAYLKYMKENCKKAAVDVNSCDHLSFDLIYVDGDSTPELLVRQEDGGDETDVITFYKGKIVEKLDLGRDGTVYYKDHSGLMLESSGRQGMYHDNVVKLNKGKFTDVHEGSRIADDVDAKTYTYTWDGKTVNKKTYNKNVEAAYNKKKAYDLAYMTYFSYAEMETELNSYK